MLINPYVSPEIKSSWEVAYGVLLRPNSYVEIC
jgi:hypothetical protein